MNKATLLDEKRIISLNNWVAETSELPGAILEVGVYRGGSLHEMALSEKKRQIYGIDTFEGLPEKTEGVDLHSKGDFSNVEFNAVKEYLAEFDNVVLMKGRFPNDFNSFTPGDLSLVHVDVDMYQSTRDVLLFASSRLLVDGIIICDDYGAPTCPGALRAVNEFIGLHADEYQVMETVNCQIVMKRIK